MQAAKTFCVMRKWAKDNGCLVVRKELTYNKNRNIQNTHLLLNGSIMRVPDEKNNDLLRRFAEMIDSLERLYMVELRTSPTFKMFSELDISTKRPVSADNVVFLAKLIHTGVILPLFGDSLRADKKDLLVSYCPCVKDPKKPGTYKTGVHLNWNFPVDVMTAKMARIKVVETLEAYFSDPAHGDDGEDDTASSTATSTTTTTTTETKESVDGQSASGIPAERVPKPCIPWSTVVDVLVYEQCGLRLLYSRKCEPCSNPECHKKYRQTTTTATTTTTTNNKDNAEPSTTTTTTTTKDMVGTDTTATTTTGPKTKTDADAQGPLKGNQLTRVTNKKCERCGGSGKLDVDRQYQLLCVLEQDGSTNEEQLFAYKNNTLAAVRRASIRMIAPKTDRNRNDGALATRNGDDPSDGNDSDDVSRSTPFGSGFTESERKRISDIVETGNGGTNITTTTKTTTRKRPNTTAKRTTDGPRRSEGGSTGSDNNDDVCGGLPMTIIEEDDQRFVLIKDFVKRIFFMSPEVVQVKKLEKRVRKYRKVSETDKKEGDRANDGRPTNTTAEKMYEDVESGSETFYLASTRSHYCANKKGDHGQSFVYFVVTMRGTYQKCFSKKDVVYQPSNKRCSEYRGTPKIMNKDMLSALFTSYSLQMKRKEEKTNKNMTAVFGANRNLNSSSVMHPVTRGFSNNDNNTNNDGEDDRPANEKGGGNDSNKANTDSKNDNNNNIANEFGFSLQNFPVIRGTSRF